ncbi:hypothetical protein MTR67_015593 [Solanum verrucosum]|uniref:Uncharacterized protein n=1 Tax=Solanum verrucosum TaxID=315347 RepID=A0AAF0TP78_SOLVR|nr:early nodulin-75-like [Solanum verrucosum]WMV22208.1 hypothetical protein MTR67_015593 [Solanum verrucosum]
MGRIGAKPIHQFQVQHQNDNDQHQLQPHQEYASQVESFDHYQAPETIDEIHPPSIESFHEDLYPEENQDEPPQELTMASESQENQDSVLQQQYVQAAPQQMSRPVTTQVSQQNGKNQRPRKQPKPKSPLHPSQHNSFPIHDPQPQAEAFPPPQSKPLPHPFPPAQDYYEPDTFPPTQEEEEHAFPPTVPQAFPPAQDSYEPQGFPPTPNKAHAFPPPQVDPQLYSPQARPHAFVPQNHNVPVFTNSQPQAGTNFPQYSLAQGSQIGMGMGQYQQGTQPASPMMGIPFKPLLPTESWKTGLFDCMEDPTNALITACFPCLTFGQIAEIVDSGQTPCTTSGFIYGAILMFIGMPCIMSCTYRTKLRSQYGLIESPAPDWVIHCFCEYCALCQEYRELHHRGLDPSIGWQGNQAQNQNMQLQQATMVPPVHQAMG